MEQFLWILASWVVIWCLGFLVGTKWEFYYGHHSTNYFKPKG